MYSEPGIHFNDFRVFNRFTKPGILEIRSLHISGTVSIFGQAEEFRIRAGQTVEKELPPETYTVSILYDNGVPDEKEVQLINIFNQQTKSFVSEKTVLEFDYRPGALHVFTVTAGNLHISGVPDASGVVRPGSVYTQTIPPGSYTLSMEYADKYVENQTINIVHDKDIQVRFTYVIPAPPTGFVFIPPGTFVMGSPASESEAQGRTNEQQHRVTISSSFYMAARQVTQREYQNIMGTNPSTVKGDNLPVETVKWYDAVRYCNERSVKEGLRPVYTINGQHVTMNMGVNGYRLPTEAEWEYACRAETATPYYTGNTITTSQANFSDAHRQPLEVGRFPPNKWGLYDMAGNVWEWCWDWSASFTGEAQTDPTGVANGDRRIVRGGAFNNTIGNLRSAYRGSDYPGTGKDNLGFRVVRSYELSK
jgi:formylglycine-generating enzyme required for sulfatase activity